MTIRIIDIETTGTDPNEDAIIEIASVDLVKGGGITNLQETFVASAKPIPATASAVHHILPEDLLHAPPLAVALSRFRGAHVYTAHNSRFEQGFFEANEEDLGTWVCTYRCALRAWPDLEAHNNQFLRYHLGLAEPFGFKRKDIAPHRALSDCIVTAAILERLMAEHSWSTLVAWSQEPALFTRFSFGKYRGDRYDDIIARDPGYIDWVMRSDMDEDVKFSVTYWRQLRAA